MDVIDDGVFFCLDFAVGAPYRDNEEKGAVYIYLGQENHLFTLRQVILCKA